MSSRGIIRPQADLDIDRIADFIGQSNPTAGLRFLEAVDETIKSLAEMPSFGSPCEFPSPQYRNLRTWPVRGFKNHIIFFQSLPQVVEVVRVLHGARDYQAILGNG